MWSVALIALICAHEVAPLAEDPPPPPPSRVAVIGASLSGGFGLRSELGADYDLAQAFELAWSESGHEFHDFGNNLFVSDAETLGAGQVQRARALEPELVIAIDFLFWFAYGYRGDCAARTRSFEVGLQLLETIEGNLLVGDLLDARPALRGGTAFNRGRPVIRQPQIPEVECLARLNERLTAWAAERERVHVYDLSRFYAESFTEEPLELRGNRYELERKNGLLQPDLLHPTYKGLAGVTLSALDRLSQTRLLDEEDVDWDAGALEQAIWAATQEEREARARRKAERERKKAEREERRRREEEEPRSETLLLHR